MPHIWRGGDAAVADGPLYCCYGCSLAARLTRSHGEAGQVNWMLTRLGMSAFLSMSVMVFSYFQYSQEVYATPEDMAVPLNATIRGMMRYLCLIFSSPVFFMLGVPIFYNALDQFRHRVFSADALVVLGVGAAFIQSYVATLTDRGGTYYETACMVLVLLTFGRWLEASGKLRASDAVKALQNLIPDEVTIRRDDQEITIRSQDIQPGDRIIVRAGQRIAADGEIEAGQVLVDEQIITGESVPVVKAPGDSVRAGTLSLDGTLTVRATAVGAVSTLGRMVGLLEEAKYSKGHYQRLTERIASLFVPLTLLLTAAGVGLGYHRGGFDAAILTGLSVMLIACPCALGIATPMALWVSLGRAATHGILFRGGEVIEKLATVRAVCFDKTGTLTTGSPVVAEFIPAATLEAPDRPAPPSESQTLALAWGLARHSTHALSHSICDFAEQRGLLPIDVADVRTIPGRGLIGSVNGTTITLGNIALMNEQSQSLTAALREQVDRLIGRGQGLACLGRGQLVIGLFAFTESMRPEARQVVVDLKRNGCRVLVLTGDHHRRGEAIASELDVETAAELLPEDKIRMIRQVREQTGPVAMIGDGLNDAPALAAADVGIALGCGADVTRESADICLLGDNLQPLPGLLQLARKTVRTIRGNLFWAFAYNVAGIALALAGKLGPTFAAVAMVISSLMVVTRSLRLGNETGASKG